LKSSEVEKVNRTGEVVSPRRCNLFFDEWPLRSSVVNSAACDRNADVDVKLTANAVFGMVDDFSGCRHRTSSRG
jgi:hypothetical protein